MLFSPFTVLATVDLGLALVLALGYALEWGTCGPPSITCLLPGVGCAAVCRDAWAQIPEVTLFGMVVGFPSAAAVYLAALLAPYPGVPASGTRRRKLCFILAAASAALLAAFFDGAFLLRVRWTVGVAIFAMPLIAVALLSSVPLFLRGEAVVRPGSRSC